MSTLRSESIMKARQEDPFLMNHSSTTQPDARVNHYAGLAQVMHETMVQFVTAPGNTSELNASPSVKDLRWRFVSSLTDQAHAVLHSDLFTHLHRNLQVSQSERSPVHWSLIEQSLEAGVHTFANTTEALFDVLSSEFSPIVAESSDNYVVLDRLAKLSIDQFVSYKSVYLDTPANHQRFAKQLQSYRSGVAFKPRFPQEAKVPTVLMTSHDLRGSDDFLLDHSPMSRITDFPEPDAIGCPITFYSGQVKELWSLYAEGRRQIRRRTDLGAYAAVRAAIPRGDTAAS